MHSAIEAFAEEARRFRHWAFHIGSGFEGAPEALQRMVALYSAALALPGSAGLLTAEDTTELGGRDEVESVRKACARLPLQYYSDVLEPLTVPTTEAGVGDLVDDIVDVFDDVSKGLYLFDQGRVADAVFEWTLLFRTHWGRHAASAIHVLHVKAKGQRVEARGFRGSLDSHAA